MSSGRTRVLAVTAAALVVLVAGGAAVGQLGGRPPQDVEANRSAPPPVPVRRASVAATLAEPPGLAVAGGRVRGARAGRLAAAAVGPLMGSLAPVAVPSPDGRFLVYSTWEQLRPDDAARSWSEQGIERGDPLGRPSLRLHDLHTGADSVLAEGAFSAAFRADGALAFLLGSEPAYRADERYVGDVVVRGSPRGRSVVWSAEPARYVVAAWAGPTLLAYRMREGERLDLVAFDDPGQPRTLAADAHLVAVSPDGRRVFVGDGSAVPATVRVLDVASGDEHARLELAAVPGTPVQWVGYAGSWSGDVVAARSDAGLALFRVRDGTVELAELLRLDPETYPTGVFEPQLLDGGTIVLARAELAAAGDADAAPTVLLVCNPAAAACRRTDPVPARDWLRAAYTPSRPKGGAN